MEAYIQQYHPTYRLIEGSSGAQYAARSVQSVLRCAIEKAGVNPFATVSMFRHSFATHLLERATDIRYIRHLVGHSAVKMTAIDNHVTQKGGGQVRSLLDYLDVCYWGCVGDIVEIGKLAVIVTNGSATKNRRHWKTTKTEYYEQNSKNKNATNDSKR